MFVVNGGDLNDSQRPTEIDTYGSDYILKTLKAYHYHCPSNINKTL